jgi:excisionase family DNA binding protein
MKKSPQEISKPSAPIAASEGYLDKVAVAKRLGLKPRTVGEWAKQGKLPAYRLGPYLRFKWAEVEQHLAATCQLKRGVRSAECGVFSTTNHTK